MLQLLLSVFVVSFFFFCLFGSREVDQYFIKYFFIVEIDLIRVQLCWSAVYQFRAETSWLVAFRILFFFFFFKQALALL